MEVLSPATFLTKICIVSSGSAEAARECVELREEMLLERMVAAAAVMIFRVGMWVVRSLIVVDSSDVIGSV